MQSLAYSVERPRRLYEALGNPQLQYATVHVGGTNGKGSVTTKIAKALQCSGYRVGMFTSPHISSFRERIQINGKFIGEEELMTLATLVLQKAEDLGLNISFFESVAAIAFLFFQQKEVDIAVIEVGLGGRLDATNALNPLLTVITSISLEHTGLLGNSIDEIAREKAGILKSQTPVVVGPTVPMKSLAEAKSVFVSDEDHPKSIARCALDYLRKIMKLDQNGIDFGIEALPPCRMEFTSDDSALMDVAHNPASLERLFNTLRVDFPYRKFRVVLGLSRDKDIPTCLEIVTKNASFLHLVPSQNERCLSTEEWENWTTRRTLPPYNLGRDVYQEVRNAHHLAKLHDELLVVTGTFFIMSEARRALGFNDIRDPIDMNERMN
ncbi:MAG: hypothetical protein Tsb0021_11370 [Chlamydiales bacterium]